MMALRAHVLTFFQIARFCYDTSKLFRDFYLFFMGLWKLFWHFWILLWTSHFFQTFLIFLQTLLIFFKTTSHFPNTSLFFSNTSIFFETLLFFFFQTPIFFKRFSFFSKTSLFFSKHFSFFFKYFSFFFQTTLTSAYSTKPILVRYHGRLQQVKEHYKNLFQQWISLFRNYWIGRATTCLLLANFETMIALGKLGTWATCRKK